jgi:hypothetical protein
MPKRNPSNLTSNSSASPFIVSASTIFDTIYDAWTCFNGSFDVATGGWSPASSSVPQWIKADFGAAVSIDLVKLGYGTAAIPTYTAKNFEIQYSADNSAWTTAYTATNISGWVDSVFKEFSFTAISARYWRINTTENTNSGQTAGWDEIEFWGDDPSGTQARSGMLLCL